MYSSYIISRSASRMRWRMTCFAVCAAMRPKLSGVTSSRLICSSGTSDQSSSRSSSERSVWFFSPVSSSMRSSSSKARSRASSSRRSSRSGGISIEKTRKSPCSSSSTVAWRVAPGVFLYAASSASSSAVTSVPCSIPFSRSMSRTASTISWLISPTLLCQNLCRSGSPARCRRTGSRRAPPPRSAAAATAHLPTPPRRAPCRVVVFIRTRPPDGALEVSARPQRPGEARRRHLHGVPVEVPAEEARDALAECVVDALRVVDVHAEALLGGQLEREDVDTRDRGLDGLRDLAVELLLRVVLCDRRLLLTQEMGAARPFRNCRNVVTKG